MIYDMINSIPFLVLNDGFSSIVHLNKQHE